MRWVVKGVPGAKDESLRAGFGGTFSYFELGEPMQRRALLSGSKLPSWEKLASYVFFTATGEEFAPGKAEQARYLAGKASTRDVYLLYSDDIDELKDMLTKSFAQKLARVRRNALHRGRQRSRLQQAADEDRDGYCAASELRGRPTLPSQPVQPNRRLELNGLENKVATCLDKQARLFFWYRNRARQEEEWERKLGDVLAA